MTPDTSKLRSLLSRLNDPSESLGPLRNELRDALEGLLDEVDRLTSERETILAEALEWRDKFIAAEAKAKEAAKLLTYMRDSGCPACSGDCAGANPPVMFCPMQAISQFLNPEPTHES